jgi:ketosteroid isomerase-like protein
MAQDNRFDLARLEQIERRLQVLEDAEAIRNLKAGYAALCDNQYDADGIAKLFTDDAVWESPALGRFEGREAIRSFFQGASAIFSFAIHYSLNGHIEVEGDTARARWYLFMPCTVAAGNQAVWRAGIDHETYVRVNGTWMFRHKRSEPLISVPFELILNPSSRQRTGARGGFYCEGPHNRARPSGAQAHAPVHPAAHCCSFPVHPPRYAGHGLPSD